MSKLEGFANLKAGDSFKNYLEVCAAVGEEKKTGNGQIAQVKRWEEMVEWARVGRRWRVVRVRSAFRGDILLNQLPVS